jgi:hypothetical protein
MTPDSADAGPTAFEVQVRGLRFLHASEEAVMSHTLAPRHMLSFGVRFFEHTAAIVIGLVLMILGLALGVTMIMLPVGIAMGLVGVAVLIGGLFTRIDGA